MLLLPGCGYIQQLNGDNAQQLRISGYDPYHVDACGPVALSDLMKFDGVKMESKEISRSILASQNFDGFTMRHIGAIINSDGWSITDPMELSEFAKKQGYFVSIITGEHANLVELTTILCKDKERCIVLMQNGFGSVKFHYKFIQQEDDIFHQYGNKTIIRALFFMRPTTRPSTRPAVYETQTK